jgi:hypothetical protein
VPRISVTDPRGDVNDGGAVGDELRHMRVPEDVRRDALNTGGLGDAPDRRVELKRYSVNVEVEVLREQGLKYYRALQSLLDQQSHGDEAIEIVFVLGHKPKTSAAGASSPDEHIESVFSGIHGRYVLYDEMIENAGRQYEDYLEASETAHALDQLLADLDVTA